MYFFLGIERLGSLFTAKANFYKFGVKLFDLDSLTEISLPLMDFNISGENIKCFLIDSTVNKISTEDILFPSLNNSFSYFSYNYFIFDNKFVVYTYSKYMKESIIVIDLKTMKILCSKNTNLFDKLVNSKFVLSSGKDFNEFADSIRYGFNRVKITKKFINLEIDDKVRIRCRHSDFTNDRLNFIRRIDDYLKLYLGSYDVYELIGANWLRHIYTTNKDSILGYSEYVTGLRVGNIYKLHTTDGDYQLYNEDFDLIRRFLKLNRINVALSRDKELLKLTLSGVLPQKCISGNTLNLEHLDMMTNKHLLDKVFSYFDTISFHNYFWNHPLNFKHVKYKGVFILPDNIKYIRRYCFTKIFGIKSISTLGYLVQSVTLFIIVQI